MGEIELAERGQMCGPLCRRVAVAVVVVAAVAKQTTLVKRCKFYT